MVDKIQNQTIDFLGEINKKGSSELDEYVMDYPTQVAICQMNKNYNKMINNMFATCANICIKTFNYPKLNEKEKNCAEICQKKFYSSYFIGQQFVTAVIEESKKIDLFSDKTELDVILSTRKN